MSVPMSLGQSLYICVYMYVCICRCVSRRKAPDIYIHIYIYMCVCVCVGCVSRHKAPAGVPGSARAQVRWGLWFACPPPHAWQPEHPLIACAVSKLQARACHHHHHHHHHQPTP